MHLQQLAIGICQQINIFDPAHRSFINKICWMIEAGADISLIYETNQILLQITGVRITVVNGQPVCSTDDNSIATLKVSDFGHKIHWNATIGNFNWRKNWGGQKQGDIIIWESRRVFHSLFQLANDVNLDYKRKRAEKVATVYPRISVS